MTLDPSAALLTLIQLVAAKFSKLAGVPSKIRPMAASTFSGNGGGAESVLLSRIMKN